VPSIGDYGTELHSIATKSGNPWRVESTARHLLIERGNNHGRKYDPASPGAPRNSRESLSRIY